MGDHSGADAAALKIFQALLGVPVVAKTGVQLPVAVRAGVVALNAILPRHAARATDSLRCRAIAVESINKHGTFSDKPAISAV